ncbi:MAG TPA: hypothetical protein O0Y08_05305 [Methanocorpusculum sp.]|nr:hypothetical protein [Methanocorpusculum sp.]HJJ60257.1 hypothetical protein [Methanocorpusculum sp.]
MNTTSLEYALGRLMDIGGNGEIRLEILRFSRQKSQKTGCEDFALAFRIGREGEKTAEETAGGTAGGNAGGNAGAGAGKEAGPAAGTGTAAGKGADKGTGRWTGTAAGTAAAPAPAALDITEIMEA